MSAVEKLIPLPNLKRQMVAARVEAVFGDELERPGHQEHPDYITVWATIHVVDGIRPAWLVIDCLTQGSLEVPRELYASALPSPSPGVVCSVFELLQRGFYEEAIEEAMADACRSLHSEIERERSKVFSELISKQHRQRKEKK